MAEATASILKLVSGRLADRGWNPKRLVIGGYSVSNGARPLIGLALGWGWVLALRFLDRVGKGIRTSPRDALISASTSGDQRGKAFGFHRALDNAGAMAGPLLAFGLLSAGVGMAQVFLLSVVPGLAVLLLLLLGLPGTPIPAPRVPPQRLRWRGLNPRLKGLILAAGGLALATTPEVFLVLWVRARGLEITWVPLIWAAASAVKAVVAAPAGALSDAFGRLPVLVTGWGLRIAVLIALGLAGPGPVTLWGLFLAYAATLALTEGAERALIGDYAPADQRATAYGLYHMTVGLLALPGAVLFGALWEWIGEASAFFTAAALTGLSVALLLGIARRPR